MTKPGFVSRLRRFILPDLERAVIRFPLSFLCAWGLTFDVVAILLLDFDRRILESDGHLLLTAGFFWFLTIDLIREDRAWSRASATAVALAGFLPLAALTFFGTGDWSIGWPGLLVGLVLLSSVAGYMSPGQSLMDYWRFNRSYVLGAALSLAGASFSIGGLFVINESLDALFGVSFSEQISEILAPIFLIGLMATYWLAFLPTRTEVAVSTAAEGLDKAVLLLGRMVLLPLLLLYAVLLLAYAGKIGLDLSLPKGVLGTIVPAFGVTGAAAVLLLYPDRDDVRFVRWFSDWWFAVTLIPTVLLGIALWQRYASYGLTDARYALALVFIWMAVLGVVFTIKRQNRDLRWIVGGLAGLFLLTSVGPWGLEALPVREQSRAVAGILEQQGKLDAGRAHSLTSEQPLVLSGQDYGRLSGAVQYLRHKGQLSRLEPLFAESGEDGSPFPGNDETIQQRILALFKVKPGEEVEDGLLPNGMVWTSAFLKGGEQSLADYSTVLGVVSIDYDLKSALPDGWKASKEKGDLIIQRKGSDQPAAGFRFPVGALTKEAGKGFTLGLIKPEGAQAAGLALLPTRVEVREYDNTLEIIRGEFVVLQRSAIAPDQ
ncbi:DUF4153 domain-containing protein [Coralliovum pocilloporae]|uniref:DUF4153 domain-containing protein n=1 Tax=Coralliovum pocilloporae TaxID=3066369 RepID=UPI003307BDDB